MKPGDERVGLGRHHVGKINGADEQAKEHDQARESGADGIAADVPAVQMRMPCIINTMIVTIKERRSAG